MNKAILVGRLTKDPEIRVTENQKTIARFTVAVNRVKEGADFLNCVAFDRKAELLEKYFHKGDRIGVIGSIRIGSYTNKEGQKVNTTEIMVDEIEFLQDKREEVPGIDDNPFLT
jgi:single-strand DNA-binding protein